MKHLSYRGWKNCYQLEAGDCTMIATADVGPRIVHLSKGDRPNLLKLFDDQVGKSGGNEWRVYGGHRLWSAPEDPVTSYIPDNWPTEVESVFEGEVSLRVSLTADLEKSLIMRVANKSDSFTIINKIKNIGKKSLKTASWGITSFIPGGIGYMPLSKSKSPRDVLQANGRINLWDYTDLSDRAFRWHPDCLEIDQAKVEFKQKIGTYCIPCWAAYRFDDILVVKMVEDESQASDGAEYPDQGSNVEIYLDQHLLELEGLSQYKTLQPGESVSHSETLHLIEVDPQCGYQNILKIVQSKVKSNESVD